MSLDAGVGWSLYSRPMREYIYACPLSNTDRWPTSLSVITKVVGRIRYHPSAVPVEVPTRLQVKRPLAACVHVAYQHLDPVRLVEWFELQRILGISLVGVYLMSNFSQSAERVFRYTL